LRSDGFVGTGDVTRQHQSGSITNTANATKSASMESYNFTEAHTLRFVFNHQLFALNMIFHVIETFWLLISVARINFTPQGRINLKSGAIANERQTYSAQPEMVQ
jgi:hypothetical protein